MERHSSSFGNVSVKLTITYVMKIGAKNGARGRELKIDFGHVCSSEFAMTSGKGLEMREGTNSVATTAV